MNMEADFAYAVERLIQIILRMNPNCSQAELLAAVSLDELVYVHACSLALLTFFAQPLDTIV